MELDEWLHPMMAVVGAMPAVEMPLAVLAMAPSRQNVVVSAASSTTSTQCSQPPECK